MVDRGNQFKIRLSDDEVTWLEALAENAGVTKTDYVRLLIRRANDERLASEKPKRR
jgi:predicted DNA-binding protein